MEVLSNFHDGETPKCCQVLSGEIPFTEINKKGSFDETPLHIAAKNEHVQCLQFLLENGANINSLNCFRVTALHAAAHHGHLNCLRLLLEHGADLNSRAALGSTPFQFAVTNGKIECAKLLIDFGFDTKRAYEMVSPGSLRFHSTLISEDRDRVTEEIRTYIDHLRDLDFKEPNEI
jgi:ankyrin repeat protein